MDRAKVLSVQENTALASLMKQALSSEPELELAWETTSVSQALNVLSKVTPDVIIMDIHLSEMCGLDAIPRMLEQAPQAKVILLTDEDDRRYQRAATSNGAHACIRKDLIATALVMSIRKVLKTPFGRSQGDELLLMKENV